MVSYLVKPLLTHPMAELSMKNNIAIRIQIIFYQFIMRMMIKFNDKYYWLFIPFNIYIYKTKKKNIYY